MSNFLDDYQWKAEQSRKAAAAADQERLRRQNEEARILNERDAARRDAEDAKRQADAAALREAEFRAAVRASYPAMDNSTFDAEWPRLRVKAMEEASARSMAERLAMLGGVL